MSNKENRVFEFKSELLKDFGKYPDNKISAKKFVALKLKELNNKLKLEKTPRKRYVLKKLIKIYEEIR
jgi:hypothetical protein